MNHPDLLELLRIESNEINSAFIKASVSGNGTPQEVADRREEAFSSVLRKYFPFPHRVVKGNIVDSYGHRSASIDCLVLSPSHPYTIDEYTKKASIIFADGVDYAIEVKPDLTKKDEVGRALRQIQSVKQLKRKRQGTLDIISKTEEEKKHLYRIPSFIFATKAPKDPHDLMDSIVDYYEQNHVPAIEQFDIIVVNNSYLVFNCGPKMYIQYEDSRALLCQNTGVDTLMLFILWMNKLPASEPRLSESILSLYIDDPQIGDIFGNLHLDGRLID